VAAGNDGVKTVVAAWLVACHKAMSISRWVGFMVAGSVREGSSYLDLLMSREWSFCLLTREKSRSLTTSAVGFL
jgi:hypothetical protein